MTKHEYICEITLTASRKATCDRARVGCVIVNWDYEIITTGYNGSPRGLPSCDELGHLLESGHCVRTVHAEQNAIVQAAKHGVSVQGCILYTTHSPCPICAKMIVNAGITEVRYRAIKGREGIKILESAGLKTSQWIQ
jgi:dCMP deaminase